MFYLKKYLRKKYSLFKKVENLKRTGQTQMSSFYEQLHKVKMNKEHLSGISAVIRYSFYFIKRTGYIVT